MSNSRKKREALPGSIKQCLSDKKRIGGSQLIAEGEPCIVTLCYMGNQSRMI